MFPRILQNISISEPFTGFILHLFNGQEKDDEWNGTTGGAYDFGARIYDARICRWLSMDKNSKDLSNFSPYVAYENSPISLNDPDGNNAVYTIVGNTITFSTTILMSNTQMTADKATQMQNDLNNYYPPSTYTDPVTKQVYNVKFDFKVQVVDPTTFDINKVTPGTNGVLFIDTKNYRSRVIKFLLGKFSKDPSTKTVAHEVGHFLGLADRYVRKKYVSSKLNENNSLAPKEPDGERIEICGNTKADELMAGGSTFTQDDVNALSSFALQNQKDGKGVINRLTLIGAGKGTGLNAPTPAEKNTTLNPLKNSAGTPYQSSVVADDADKPVTPIVYK